MGKIYIVTSGSYSDYSIEAVFSSEELAQKFIEATHGGRWDAADIEVWDLDPRESELKQGFNPYFGRITKEGNITELEQRYSSWTEENSHGFDVNKNMYTSVWARDENHARKIIAERHAVVVANGEWPSK